MRCLVPFFDDVLLVVHDGNLGISEVRVLVGPDDDWQHQNCGPRTAEAGALFYLDQLGAAPSTATVAPGAVVQQGPSSDGTDGLEFALGGAVVGGLLLLPLLAGGIYLAKRRWSRRGNSDAFEAWLDAVTGEDRDPERFFTREQKAKGLRRCGGRCEWVDDESGERCSVVEGLNGVRLQGDHIYPHDRNGRTSMKNLAMLCDTCNKAKSAKLPSEALVRNILNNRTAKAYLMGAVSASKSRPQKVPVNSSELFEWEEDEAA